ncbi:hypothetical protein VTK26DRAFT_874 [Humicola hyalothermophila]
MPPVSVVERQGENLHDRSKSLFLFPSAMSEAAGLGDSVTKVTAGQNLRSHESVGSRPWTQSGISYRSKRVGSSTPRGVISLPLA